MSLPRFKGKSNQLKCQVWLLLAQCRYFDHWLRSEEIAQILGVNLRSLRTGLAKWTSPTWKRVLRRKRDYLWEYKLSYKGLRWIESYEMFMPITYSLRVQRWRREHLFLNSRGYWEFRPYDKSQEGI